MLTKESFVSSCTRIPYSKVTIEGLGEVGIRLFTGKEIEELNEDDDLDLQIAFVLIGEDGERVFGDSDLDIIKNDMPFAYKIDIMDKLRWVNGLDLAGDEIKKN